MAQLAAKYGQAAAGLGDSGTSGSTTLLLYAAGQRATTKESVDAGPAGSRF
ncbi:hypothetical protein ACQP2F_14135 [Actinoplanes sp. CA-030573]|uniref:hypothetical protein n=1 Tax=Actinoplanes sp. CA-030573 TaxID=3239898 RepID=UPI003D8F0883